MTGPPSRRELSRRVDDLADGLGTGEPLEIAIRNRNIDGEILKETRIRYDSKRNLTDKEVDLFAG